MFGLPIALITALGGKLLETGLAAYNKTKDVTMAGYGVASTVVSAQSAYMTAVLGHPLSPPSLLCYAVALHYIKAIAYDPIISQWLFHVDGYTAPLKGETAYAAGIILTGMFSAGILSYFRK